jgi:hypothetical protein
MLVDLVLYKQNDCCDQRLLNLPVPTGHRHGISCIPRIIRIMQRRTFRSEVDCCATYKELILKLE